MQREMKPTKINREKLIGRNMGSFTIERCQKSMFNLHIKPPEVVGRQKFLPKWSQKT